MARPVWKGQISFGLVNVPITLYSGERRADLSFRLIDSRNTARIRYERVNEETGEEVPWDKIVKGYEYDGGSYVLLSQDELEHASAELTRTIEIEQFIDISEIDVRFFDKPYVLVPSGKGHKGYVLLREAIARSQRAGIAKVVIRSRQYLAALVVHGDALLLEILRFPQELRAMDEFELPSSDLKKEGVTKKEIDLATQLIDGMTADWDPAEYRDEYRDVLMKLIEKKIQSGKTEAIELAEEEEEPEEPKTINFMDVLKRSVEETSKGGKGIAAAGKKAASSKAPKRKAKKKRAS